VVKRGKAVNDTLWSALLYHYFCSKNNIFLPRHGGKK
jgi:hypothetical protein